MVLSRSHFEAERILSFMRFLNNTTMALFLTVTRSSFTLFSLNGQMDVPDGTWMNDLRAECWDVAGDAKRGFWVIVNRNMFLEEGNIVLVVQNATCQCRKVLLQDVEEHLLVKYCKCEKDCVESLRDSRTRKTNSTLDLNVIKPGFPHLDQFIVLMFGVASKNTAPYKHFISWAQPLFWQNVRSGAELLTEALGFLTTLLIAYVL